MSRAFLDLTDASLTLSAVFGSSSAMRLFAQLKRRPLDVRTDMLSQLATTPLGKTFVNARHTADLTMNTSKAVRIG